MPSSSDSPCRHGAYRKRFQTEDRWDPIAAEVGGTWDVLLASGESIWAAIAPSDYHEEKGDHAPCAFARTHVLVPERTVDGILAGLNWLATEQYWLAFLAAVAMAAVAGLMPGVSAGLLMALAVPFIVFTVHDPVIGIVMLATITGVEEMLDVLPIVVLGHPGGGQVTFIEARPLASKGHAAHVLGFIYMVSALGGLIGAVALLLVVPVIKPFILKFSFA